MYRKLILSAFVYGRYYWLSVFENRVLRGKAGSEDGYTLVTLPRIVTPYRDSVDGTRNRVTHQKLVTR
jgi:hypothetical protein